MRALSAGGCAFEFAAPQSIFASDQSNYSVSRVYVTADVQVDGPPDAQVMLVCSFAPRVIYWFWISADGHWNIDEAIRVTNPRELVSSDHVNANRRLVKVGQINHLSVSCSRRELSMPGRLIMSVNGHEIGSVDAPDLPSEVASKPLANPSRPWFVDIAARLPGSGALRARVEHVNLYRAPQ